MAAERVVGLASTLSGSLGEGANFSPLVAPTGTSPELRGWHGQGVQGMDSPDEGSGSLYPWLAEALGRRGAVPCI